MDFWQLLTVMVRRWYVTVPILLITAVLAVNLPERVDPTYRANGTLVLVAPAREAANLNPLVTAGLPTNAEALATVAGLPGSKDLVGAAGLSTRYSVQAEGAVLLVEANADTPAEASETVRFVEQQTVNRLNEQQQAVGAPVESFLTLVPVVGDVAATPVYTDQTRLRILVVAIGVLVAMLAAVAAEGVAARRRPRRHRGSSEGSARPAAPTEVDDTASREPEEDLGSSTETPDEVSDVDDVLSGPRVR